MLRIHDAVLNAGAFGLLMTGLAALDNDVRRHLMNLLGGDAVGELAVMTAPVDRAMRAAMETLRDYQSDNGPLFAFAVAAVVLFGFLFKS